MTQLSIQLENHQRQLLTPRLQYAVRLLQLSSLDYEQEIYEWVAKNPFLELSESAYSPSRVTSNAQSAQDFEWPDSSVALPEVSNEVAQDTWVEPQDFWLQSSSDIPHGAHETQPAGLEETRATDMGLRHHLRGQAQLLHLSDRDRTLLCAVIESLDDDGYLRLDLAEVADLVGYCPPPDVCEMRTALKLLQSFEPAGVGARSVVECLLLQIEDTDCTCKELMRTIVAEHLDRLVQRDVTGLARVLGRPVAEIDVACNRVRGLNPRPGWRYGGSDVQFIKPDVVARKVGGKWTVQLNPDVVPRLQYNHAYAKLFQQHRAAHHVELGACLKEARWAIRNVAQRFSTILSVAKAILLRQYGFFEYGALGMKPLALRDIAEEVELHESTVCRVCNNKYMATPSGLMELKQFFSRSLPMSSGGVCSATAIRGLVQEIIAAENPGRPLSDVEIAQRLVRQGLTVARRTVTKYRQMLKIPSVAQRSPCNANSVLGAGTPFATLTVEAGRVAP